MSKKIIILKLELKYNLQLFKTIILFDIKLFELNSLENSSKVELFDQR